MIKYNPIEIRLLEAPDLSITKFAWQASRTKQDRTPLEELLQMDFPLLDLSHWTFHLRVPVLLREILVTDREHLVWSRSTRVDSLDEWQLWSGIEDHDELREHVQEIYKRMQAERHSSGLVQGQESWRQLLPMSYMADFSWKISTRNLFKCITYLKRLNKALYSESDLTAAGVDKLRLMLYNFICELSGILSSSRNLEVPEHYGTHEWLPAIDEGKLFDKDYRLQQWQSISVQLPNASWALRSQVVRHGALQIRDNLKATIMALGDDTFHITMREKTCHLELYGQKEVWRGILEKRNCWLAQKDLWYPILEQVNKSEHFLEVGLVLPCTDSSCPFPVDNAARLAGEDPGLPCPIWLREEERLTPLSDEMRAYVRESLRPDVFWNNRINEVI